jgi:hypothetical protein
MIGSNAQKTRKMNSEFQPWAIVSTNAQTQERR